MFDRMRERFSRQQLDGIADMAHAANRPEVADAIGKAKASGIPIVQILLALAPFFMAIFSGGTVDWTAILKAIQDLLSKKAEEQTTATA